MGAERISHPERRIGPLSWLAVLILAGEALLEAAALPFRVALFLARKKAIREEMKEILLTEKRNER